MIVILTYGVNLRKRYGVNSRGCLTELLSMLSIALLAGSIVVLIMLWLSGI